MSLTSPLHDQHELLGAKFVQFGEWLMPIEYAQGGVVSEHEAVRGSVGIFDVSHLGTIEIKGTGTLDALQSILTNDLSQISNGSAQYTLLLNDEGGVVDDLLVYRLDSDSVVLVPNAANNLIVLETLKNHLPAGVSAVDRQKDLAIIAIQGPKSHLVMSDLGLPFDMSYMEFRLQNEVLIARSGYTGEIGFEVILPNDMARDLWSRALASVEILGGLPAGLGARDTLRTEMGYALHGHELSLVIDPLQAGLGWAIGWNKPDFLGREALIKLREQPVGSAKHLVGLKTLERAVLRPGMTVTRDPSQIDPSSQQVVGLTTSGTFSPTLKSGIALALISDEIHVGSTVGVDVRGRSVACTVVRPPFVDRNPKSALPEVL